MISFGFGVDERNGREREGVLFEPQLGPSVSRGGEVCRVMNGENCVSVN